MTEPRFGFLTDTLLTSQNILKKNFFRAAPVAYGSYQAKGQPIPQPQQHRIQAASVTYTTFQGKLDP